VKGILVNNDLAVNYSLLKVSIPFRSITWRLHLNELLLSSAGVFRGPY